MDKKTVHLPGIVPGGCLLFLKCPVWTGYFRRKHYNLWNSVFRLISDYHVISVFLFADFWISEMLSAESLRQHFSGYHRISFCFYISFSISQCNALILTAYLFTVFFFFNYSGIYFVLFHSAKVRKNIEICKRFQIFILIILLIYNILNTA